MLSKAQGSGTKGEKKPHELRINSCTGRNASTYPLGTVLRNNIRERRRSAGDEQGLAHQLNMFVRTRTDSGKQLSDAVSIG